VRRFAETKSWYHCHRQTEQKAFGREQIGNRNHETRGPGAGICNSSQYLCISPTSEQLFPPAAEPTSRAAIRLRISHYYRRHAKQMRTVYFTAVLYLLSPHGIRTFTVFVCLCRFLVHGQVTIIFAVSVCLFVCLFVQSFSQPSLVGFRSNYRTYVICLGLVVSPRI